MSILGNIVWLLLGGFCIFMEYAAGAIALCVTIIGIPFGIQCFKLAVLALLPFGRHVQCVPGGTGCLSTVMNIVWIIFFGLWIALSHVLWAAVCAITIVGLPFAVQHMKLARLAFTPFGLQIK
jgi:uncharacterized membrane protein YccF (DUF307 family)